MLSLEYIVQMVISERKLSTSVCRTIPDHMAGAAGYYSVDSDTVHLDMQQDEPKVSELFTLVHELRHAEQYTYPKRFSPLIRMNLNHIVMYDGTAYKHSDGLWFTCKVSGEPNYLRELYSLSPMEIDANDFARLWLSEKMPDYRADIERAYAFWRPPNLLIPAETAESIYWNLFKYIDENAIHVHGTSL